MSPTTKLKFLLNSVSRLSRRHPLWVFGVGPVLALPICVVLSWALGRVYHAGEVLPGIWVNEFVASGLERGELDKGLGPLAERLSVRPVTAHLDGSVFRLEPSQIAARPNVAKTAELALTVGRESSLFSQFRWWLASFFGAEQLAFVVGFERTKLDQLAEQWERIAISDPPIAGDVRSQGGTLVVERPRVGRRIDRARLARDLERVLGRTQTRVVEISTERVQPKLDRTQIDRAFARGQELVSAPIRLVSADGKVVLDLGRDALQSALRSRPEIDPPRLEVYFDSRAVDEIIQKDRQRFENEPVDASFRIGKDQQVHIVPGRPGTRLDRTMVAEALLQAAHARARVGLLPVERDALPEFTTEDARALNIVKLVGRFSTRHACCQARVQNIHRIADLLNGTVVLPGQVFSVNEKVGPRTKASGFVPAPTIVEGDMEDTIGGGVSQFATTFFNALFYAGYDIIERQPHSYWFPRYPMGHEATLSYPKPDIIFRNDTQAGLLIITEYSDTQVTVKLYGDNDGRTVRATVSERMDIVDPPVELVADPSTEPDEEKALDAGMIGWSVIVGRVITFKDKTQKVEKRKVTYMPRLRRVRVHPCRIPEGEKGYTGQDCPEPADAEIEDDRVDSVAADAPASGRSAGRGHSETSHGSPAGDTPAQGL